MAALLSAVFMVYRFKRENPVAYVYKNDELVRTVELKEGESFEFTVGEDEHYNIVKVENGGIRVKAASCPDKICVKQGLVKNGLVPIVCLPNGLVIEIKGEKEEGADALSR